MNIPEYIFKNLEKSVQWFFRALIVVIVICYVICISVLPKETDEYFERGGLNDNAGAYDENSIIYNGEFKYLNRSGELVKAQPPCHVEAYANDVVTIVSTIPNDYDKDFIVIKSMFQDISIYVNGENRVEYNTANSRPFGSQSISRYVFCRTTPADAGKELKIELSSDNIYGMGQIESVYACDKYTFWMIAFKNGGLNVLFSFVAIGCSLLIIVIGFIMTIKLKFGTEIENVGWCVLMVGVFLLSGSQLMQNFVPNFSAFSDLGFLVIMLCPIPLLLYFDEAQRGRYRRIYRGLIGASILNAIGINVLQFLDIADYLDTLIFAHVMLALSFLTVFITVIIDIKNHHIRENIRMFIGFSVLMVSAGIEIIAVYMNALTGTAVVVGALIFAILAVINTFYQFEELRKLQQEQKMETMDYLTGLLLRNKGEKLIQKEMDENAGSFMFFDMDNLKVINDTYGHKFGDSALKAISETICAHAGENIVCRVGGDEFIAFFSGYDTQKALETVQLIIGEFRVRKETLPNISKASLSVGISMTKEGDSFENAKSRADKALYHVKQSGKDGYYFYRELVNDVENGHDVDLEHIVNAIKTAGGYKGSLNIEYREFTKLYEYLAKICERYKHTCHLALVTVNAENTQDDYDIEYAMESMNTAIKDNIRNVDVCTRYSSVQFLIILLEAGEENVDTIMQRIFTRFHNICVDYTYIPHYKSCMMGDFIFSQE